jgi:hypothetical protein
MTMAPPKRDRFDEMLANWKTLLPQMRDKWGRSNCPLTAEAVWKYFQTGKIFPARPFLDGTTKMMECGTVKPLKDPKEVRRYVKQHGEHAIVTVNPGGPKEHSSVVVNIRGTVYLVDAYNAQPVLTPSVEESLAYGSRWEIVVNSNLHLVPVELVETFSCPDPSNRGR